jgi:16S rRNA (cytosine967-C5)-methyltransferase
MSNAREIAMKVIYDVEFNGAYSNMALKKALKTDMPKQDKAFISNLVYGVTDRKLTLDYVIGKFSKIKLKKISSMCLVMLCYRWEKLQMYSEENTSQRKIQRQDLSL